MANLYTDLHKFKTRLDQLKEKSQSHSKAIVTREDFETLIEINYDLISILQDIASRGGLE